MSFWQRHRQGLKSAFATAACMGGAYIAAPESVAANLLISAITLPIWYLKKKTLIEEWNCFQRQHTWPVNPDHPLAQFTAQESKRLGLPKCSLRVHHVYNWPGGLAFTIPSGDNAVFLHYDYHNIETAPITLKEQKSIIAHELSHRKKGPMIREKVRSLSAQYSWTLFYLALFGVVDSPNSIKLTTILMPYAMKALSQYATRKEELAADYGAVEIMGTSEPLAAVFEKLDAEQKTDKAGDDPLCKRSLFTFLSSIFNRISATHPPLQDRINHLRSIRIEPDRHIP